MVMVRLQGNMMLGIGVWVARFTGAAGIAGCSRLRADGLYDTQPIIIRPLLFSCTGVQRTARRPSATLLLEYHV